MSLPEKVSKQVNYFETSPTDIFSICAIIFQSSVPPAQNSNRKKFFFGNARKRRFLDFRLLFSAPQKFPKIALFETLFLLVLVPLRHSAAVVRFSPGPSRPSSGSSFGELWEAALGKSFGVLLREAAGRAAALGAACGVWDWIQSQMVPRVVARWVCRFRCANVDSIVGSRMVLGRFR